MTSPFIVNKWLGFLSLFVILFVSSVLYFLSPIFASSQESISEVLAKEDSELYPEVKKLEAKELTFSELLDFFSDLGDKKGARYGFEVLRRVKLPPQTDYHLIGHELGYVLYDQEGIDGIAYCSDDFGNACSHSVLITYLVENGLKDLDGAMRKAFDACRKVPGGNIGYSMCFHGIGHGVLGFTEYKLAEAMRICDKLKKNNQNSLEYSECSGGVTMEMIFGLHEPRIWADEKEKYFSKSDPLALCKNEAFPKEAQPTCYIYLTPQLLFYLDTHLLTARDDQLKEAMSFCEQIPIDEYANRNGCFGGFGKEFIPMANGKDIRTLDAMPDSSLKQARDWCLMAIPTDGKRSCLLFAASAAYWGGKFTPQVPARFCSLIEQDDLKTSCYREISSIVLNSTTKLETKRFCESLPKTHKDTCLDLVFRKT